MKTKKMISMLLVGVTALGLLAGCGSQEETQKNETQQEVQDKAESEGTAETDDTAAAGGNTLVVYYSATGNTRAVAETIAEAAGGDLFALEPEEPYSDADLDWTKDDSRVSREHENESEREVALAADSVDNWESYDTVFIGYAGGIIGLN